LSKKEKKKEWLKKDEATAAVLATNANKLGGRISPTASG
jgi:hypothetical protein